MSFLPTYFVKSVLGSSFATANSSPVRAFSSPVNKTEHCFSTVTTALLLLLSLLSLTGCGFQLAGTTPEIRGYDSFFVESRVGIQQLIDQPVAGQIQSDLKSWGTEVSTKAQKGSPGIIIVNEQNTERSLSLTQALFERQVELKKSVQYQIIDASGNILVADAIKASRELIEDPNAPSAKYAERELLFEAINRDISRQLIRRFQTEISK